MHFQSEEVLPTPVTIIELTKENITKLSDDDFQDNFSDQEGRLVCLACYKMFQPKCFALLKTHLGTHPEGLLKKISIHFKPQKITTTAQNKIIVQRKSKMTKSKSNSFVILFLRIIKLRCIKYVCRNQSFSKMTLFFQK